VKYRASHAALAIGLTSLVLGLATSVHALPPPAEPLTKPTYTPSPAPANPAILPIGSPIDFVLDDSISSSKSKAGEIVHMHLGHTLVVNGVTLAAANTPATLTILNVHAAAASDNDGSVQISIQPLGLDGKRILPIRAIHEFLTIEHTGGQLSTRAATDTITDIFIPYGVFYTLFRKGHNFVLPPGAVLRAVTAATVDASDPSAIAIVPPKPIVITNDMPHADFTPAPFYTAVPPQPRRTRSPRPTTPPTQPPTPLPTPEASASPSAELTPAGVAPTPTGTG
jgi:hypothetical protein